MRNLFILINRGKIVNIESKVSLMQKPIKVEALLAGILRLEEGVR